MSEVACEAGLWYNEPINIVVLGSAGNTPSRTHLIRRYVVDTLPSHALSSNIPEKRCSKCGEKFPATPDFFYRNKLTKDGLLPHCKGCRSKADKEYSHRPAVQAHNRAVRNDYRSQPEVQAREDAYVRVYNKGYYSRPDIQEHRRAISKTYLSRSDVKAHKQVVRKVYRSRPEAPDQERKYNSLRRARKNAVLGDYTPEQIQQQLKRQKCKCYYCFKRFQKIRGKYAYHIDHTFPLSRVTDLDIPANDISYLVLACPACNLSKSNKFPWEFPEGGRLL